MDISELHENIEDDYYLSSFFPTEVPYHLQQEGWRDIKSTRGEYSHKDSQSIYFTVCSYSSIRTKV